MFHFPDFFSSSSFGAKTTFHFPPNHCKRRFERRSQETTEVEGKTDFTGLSRVFVAVEERARGHRLPVLTEQGRLLSSASFLSATSIHDLSLGIPAVADKVAANDQSNQPKYPQLRYCGDEQNE